MRSWIDLIVTLSESAIAPNFASLFYGSDSENIRDDVIHLTNSPEHSGNFGSKVFIVRMKRPLNTITNQEIENRGVSLNPELSPKWAKENGFDGIWSLVGEHNGDPIWELACYANDALEVIGEHLDEGKKRKRKKHHRKSSTRYYGWGGGPVYNVTSDGYQDSGGGEAGGE